jgi:uncharacterized membrane protein YciS (DUF1049 family)
VVALLLLFSKITILLFLVFGVMMLLSGDRQMGIWSLICMGGFVLLQLIATWHSRKLTCGLCHGTILHEKRCLKHERAEKWPLIGYRATAMLRIIFTLGFTCMYCGSIFRLRK